MTDTCWFCKKNPADGTKTIKVPFYKEVHREPVGSRVRIIWHSTEALIPRCSECAKAHARVRKANFIWRSVVIIALLVAWAVFPFLSGNTNMVCAVDLIILFSAPILLVAISRANKHYLRSLGTLPESGKKEYPEYLRLLGQGYVIGKGK